MPPIIIYRERLYFYTAFKSADETVSHWYARVKSLALKCKFGSLNDYVRDRFIMGTVNEEKLFDKLCEGDDTMSLEAALRKALLHETSVKAKSMSNNVNFVRNGAHRNTPSPSNGHTNNSNNGQRTPCKHCGWKTHQPSSCKYKEVICRACKKKGHMANICRNKNKKPTNFINCHTPQIDTNNFFTSRCMRCASSNRDE